MSTKNLWSEFAPASRDQWIEAARKELDGADPFQKLVYESGKINIYPYYDRSDINTGNDFSLPAATNSVFGVRSWVNTPLVVVTDEKTANETALHHLTSGADGILFDLTTDAVDFNLLLSGIGMNFCSVSIKGAISEALVKRFVTHTEENFPVDKITGAIFWGDTAPSAKVVALFQQWTQFHCLGLNLATSDSQSAALTHTLLNTVALFDNLTKENTSVGPFFHQLAFSTSVGTEFFIEIAKLKALKTLWKGISQAYRQPSDLYVHATSDPWISAPYQPQGNLLNGTVGGLAAILGGCDALTVVPENQNDATMVRMAKNISLVLREECHLSRVADPTAGSFYLDSIIHQLVEVSWKEFQKKVNT